MNQATREQAIRHALTRSLEDYLETIYLLIRERKLARVRDIASARGVKAGSVSPALKRLHELGLINYVRREYIDLTADGELAARRVFARHKLLTRFFAEVLSMPAEQADAEACGLEHSLSDEGMDRLVRFFEFLAVCPGRRELLASFQHCGMMQADGSSCNPSCALAAAGTQPRARPSGGQPGPGQAQREPGLARRARSSSPGLGKPLGNLGTGAPAERSLYELKPGELGRVTHVHAEGGIRQRLLDMGLLPNVLVEMQRAAPSGTPVWIRLEGSQIALRKAEAQSVLVTEA